MKRILVLALFSITLSLSAQTTLTLPQIQQAWSPGQVPRGANNSNTWYTLFNRIDSVPVLSFTSPLVNSNDTISLPRVTTHVNGYLDSSDYQLLSPLIDTAIINAPLFFVDAATTTTLAVTYSTNTLTAISNGRIANIDGIALDINSTLLYKNSSNGAYNGIYFVLDTGTVSTPYILVRYTTYNETDEVYPSQVNVVGGTVNAGKYYLQTTVNPTIGVSNIVYVIFTPSNFVPYNFANQPTNLNGQNLTNVGLFTTNEDVLINLLTVGRGRGNFTTNTSVGLYSLYSNTTGADNTSVGRSSLYSNTTGADNTSVGLYSLYSNTTGANNTSVGRSSLYSNTTGASNTSVGMASLSSNTTGASNTSVGMASLSSNTTGINNTSVGRSSLYSNTTGASNTSVGMASLSSNTTGADNTSVGRSSLYSNTTGADNTSVGLYSLYSNTTGANNTSVGRSSLYSNTTGASNTSVGMASLSSNTTGADNTSVGLSSLGLNVIGSNNISVGFRAGYNALGSGNVFLGYLSGYFETGSNKLYIDNSNTTTPLIYGNFSTDSLSINGKLTVTAAPTNSLSATNKNYVDNKYNKGSIAFNIYEGGGIVATGAKNYVVTAPYSGTITGFNLFSTSAGVALNSNTVMDVWKQSAGTLPTVANTIFSGNAPTLSASSYDTDSSLNVSVTAGDVIIVAVTSNSAATNLNLILNLTKN